MCAVEGCERKHIARGWCDWHYRKWRKHGDPLSGRECRKRKEDGTLWTYPTTRRIDGSSERAHRVIIEKALGHEIPEGAETHHIDGNKSNNKNSNLVLCDSVAYHRLLHRRKRALDACGNARWRKCKYCHQHDDPEKMYFNKSSRCFIHRSCNAEHQRLRRKRLVAQTL